MKNLIKTEYVDPITLKFAKYNPRFISDDAMVGLIASITEFGIVDPFVVNKRNNTIVGGHMRCRAAMELEIKQVPVVFVDLSPAKEKALNLTLNNQNITGDFTAGLELVLSDIKTDLPDLFVDLNLEDLLGDMPKAEITYPSNVFNDNNQIAHEKIECKQEELENKFGNMVSKNEESQVEMICPSCAETFWLKS